MLLAGKTGEVVEEALMGLATSLMWSAHSMCKLRLSSAQGPLMTLSSGRSLSPVVAGMSMM